MSTTTADVLLYRFRLMTQDESISEPVNTLPQILDAFDRAFMNIQSRLPGLVTFHSSFLSISANTYTYANVVPNVDMQRFGSFRLVSSGRPINRISLDGLLRLRQGNPVESRDPEWIAFEETKPGVLSAYLWPTPWQADTIEATYAAATASEFSGQSAQDLSGLSIDGSPFFVEAFLARACYEIAVRMGPQKIAKLDLPPSFAEAMLQSSESALKEEKDRQWKLSRAVAPVSVSRV